MQKQALMAEIGRLINAVSRRMRESDSSPSPAEITAIAKLTDSYSHLLETGEDPEDKKHSQEFIRQHGQGYEVAMGLDKK